MISPPWLLTSTGEGTHRFVLSEFTQFGTHLVAIQPGKTSTHGRDPRHRPAGDPSRTRRRWSTRPT